MGALPAPKMHGVYLWRSGGPLLRSVPGVDGCSPCAQDARSVSLVQWGPPSTVCPRSRWVRSLRPRCTECIFCAGGAHLLPSISGVFVCSLCAQDARSVSFVQGGPPFGISPSLSVLVMVPSYSAKSTMLRTLTFCHQVQRDASTSRDLSPCGGPALRMHQGGPLSLDPPQPRGCPGCPSAGASALGLALPP